MDILRDLREFVSPNENIIQYKQYIIDLISETMDNFIQVNKVYFTKKGNIFKFSDLVGEHSGSSILKDMEMFLNVNFQKTFSNIKLTIVDYTISDNAEENEINLNISVHCSLLGAPSKLLFNVNLNPPQ